MSLFEYKKCPIEGAYLIKGRYAKDIRGDFLKDFEEQDYLENNLQFHCTESFYSISKKNVIRGLHFQLQNPQAKLVTVIQGSVFDVIVDLRKKSSTSGQWFSAVLSDENPYSLYIPRGCAHGFLALRDDSVMSYKCDGQYSVELDTGIRYDDKMLQIDWPAKNGEYIVSERDRQLMTYTEFLEKYSGF